MPGRLLTPTRLTNVLGGSAGRRGAGHHRGAPTRGANGGRELLLVPAVHTYRLLLARPAKSCEKSHRAVTDAGVARLTTTTLYREPFVHAR